MCVHVGASKYKLEGRHAARSRGRSAAAGPGRRAWSAALHPHSHEEMLCCVVLAVATPALLLHCCLSVQYGLLRLSWPWQLGRSITLHCLPGPTDDPPLKGPRGLWPPLAFKNAQIHLNCQSKGYRNLEKV